MKCRYCEKESKGEFCSKDHKKRFFDRIDDCINTNCPTIISKSLDDRLVEMQNEWKKNNKKKAKKQCITA